jgi:predicted DsbA family dithiol-disulfide isomerase
VRLRIIQREFQDSIEVIEKFFPLRRGVENHAEFTEYIIEHRHAASEQLKTDAEVTDPPAFSIPPLGARYPRSSMPALEAAAFVQRNYPDRFDAFDLALFQGFFTRTEDISNIDFLVRLAFDYNISMETLREALESREFKETVMKDFRVATEEFGVTGIPTVILPDQFPIVGAVPTSQYREAVQRAIRGRPNRH